MAVVALRAACERVLIYTSQTRDRDLPMISMISPLPAPNPMLAFAVALAVGGLSQVHVPYVDTHQFTIKPTGVTIQLVVQASSP
jgi:hypothetical protein